jgi:hypothetical protein
VEFFWFLVIAVLIIVAVITIVDAVRQKNGGWSMAGWVLLIVILPAIGCLIYWITRDYTSDDVEQAFLADQDRRYETAHKPIDGEF